MSYENGSDLLDAMRGIGRDRGGHSSDDDIDDKLPMAPAENPLGDDVLDILRRRKSPMSAEVGIDLNNEDELKTLEDPGLMQHMADRRAQLRKQAQADLPDPEKLASEDVNARRGMSTVAVSLRDQIMALRCATDDVAVHGTNAAKISKAVVPHGYGDSPSTESCCAHLSRALAKTTEGLESIVAALLAMERELTVARRAADAAVAGYRARAEYSLNP